MESGPYGNIYIIALSIVATIAIMIVSAMYTIRNIKRVWSIKKKRSANNDLTKEKKSEKKDHQRTNVAGEGNSNSKDRRKDARRGRSPGKKEEYVAPETNSNNGTSKSSYQEEEEEQPEFDELKRESPDPVHFYHHILGEVNKARQRAAIKKIVGQMTKEELEEEKATQRQQLQEIFDLMKLQGDKFGLNNMDIEKEMEKQMQLYSIE